MPTTLPPESPEARIVREVLRRVKADPLLSANFSPIILVENPSRTALLAYGDASAVVQPFSVVPKEWPSDRETSLVSVLISLYVAAEETSEDSPLFGLNYGGYIRAMFLGNELKENLTGPTLTFATALVVQLTPLIPKEGVRILSYRVTFETDVQPTTDALV